MRRILLVLVMGLVVAIAPAYGDNWAGKCVKVKDGDTISGKRTKPQGKHLAKEQVIRIAEETAKAEGYDITKYNMKGCHYEYTKKDHSWTVFFSLKPPTPPGGHVAVWVDDQTKKAKLMRGE